MKKMSRTLAVLLLGPGFGLGLAVGCTVIKGDSVSGNTTSSDYAEKLKAQSQTIMCLIQENNDLRQKILDNSMASHGEMIPFKASLEDINGKLKKMSEEMDAMICSLTDSNEKLKKICTRPL